MSGVAAAAMSASALVGAVGSQAAAGKQAGAANAATAQQAQEFAIQQANEQPYQQAGVAALGQLQDPRFQHNFSASDFTASPGYQFSLKQGQDALNAANAATGNSVSGAGLAALANYNVGSANQEYQQAFNNYQTQQNNQFGRLSSIAGMGAGANAQSNAAAQNYANQANANTIGAGNAAAGAGMYGTQGIQGAIGGLGNLLGQNASASNLAGQIQPSAGVNIAGGAMDNGGATTMSQFAGGAGPMMIG